MAKRHKLPLWLQKIGESFMSVLPIVGVVLVIYFCGNDSHFSYAQDMGSHGYPSELSAFLSCAFLVGAGLGLFSIGVDQSLSRIGTLVGGALTKKKNIWYLVGLTLLIGFLISVAEPDLWILAKQIGGNLEWVIIVTISAGVAIFLIIGTLRIIFQLDLSVVFLAMYGLVFILANLAFSEFIPLAFDSGGVVTGPVTIPFILAFGAGVAASRQGSRSGSDNFGLIAHATLGPIVAILILAIFWKSGSTLSYSVSSTVLDFSFSNYAYYFSSSALSVLFAVGSVAVFFIIFNFTSLHLGTKDILKIMVGFVYCYFGLVLFLSAVQAGFSPVAQVIGSAFASEEGLPVATLIGAVFGCFAVLAEPGMAVLVNQIQTVSEGTIKKRPFLGVMAVSIALGVAMAVVRAYYQFSIMYYLVPIYILALGLTFLVPKIYTSIAFDAGTVASGPMAASFTMPFVIGFAAAVYQNSGLSGEALSAAVYENAFGVVAMVSMMPLVVVQLVGLYAQINLKIVYSKARKRIVEPDDDQIIHFSEEGEA
jgi:hypothetical protein